MTTGSPLRSEEAIIQGFLAPLAAGAPGAFGLRDDCAVASPSPGTEFVLKTDAIAEDIHFLTSDDPGDIGWKALAVNVSDLAAKGARPVAYLLSLAFPVSPTAEWMGRFARGLGEAQAAFGMHLLGGDTDRRPGPIAITPTVIGEVPQGRMVRRTTARAGDIVCVSGALGDSGLGLRLRRDPALALRWNLPADVSAGLVQRYVRPQPRLELAAALLAHARASMDLSDGLMKDLGRMCRASGVGARVDQAALPLSIGFQTVRAIDPTAAQTALFGGDDYEVLAAVPPDRFEPFVQEGAAAGIPVARIGVFTALTDIQLVDPSGARIEIGASGWDHF